MTIVNWKHALIILGGFVAVVGPFLQVMPDGWHYLATPLGAGSLLTVIGGWLGTLATYSFLDKPLGSPEQKL